MTTFHSVIEAATRKLASVITSSDFLDIIDTIKDLPHVEKERYNFQISDIFKLVPYYLLSTTKSERRFYCYALEKNYRTTVCVLFNNILYKLNHNETYYQRPSNGYVPDITLGPKINPDTLIKKDPIPVEKEIFVEIELEKDVDTDPLVIKAVVELITKLRQINKSYVEYTKTLELILSFGDVAQVIILEKPNQKSALEKLKKCFVANGWNDNRFTAGMTTDLIEKVISELYNTLYIIN